MRPNHAIAAWRCHFPPHSTNWRSFGLYLSDRYESDWGKPINFDGPGSGPVREFYLTNVRYWIDEYHLDGLRLDATQSIFDASPRSIIQEMVQCARETAGQRKVYMIGENESQDATMAMAPEEGGYGLDALWNDDFHHSAMVALTGKREAYYTDYLGSSQEFISLLKYGFLYQGQYYSWQKKSRGVPAFALEPSAFVGNPLGQHQRILKKRAKRR